MSGSLARGDDSLQADSTGLPDSTRRYVQTAGSRAHWTINWYPTDAQQVPVDRWTPAFDLCRSTSGRVLGNPAWFDCLFVRPHRGQPLTRDMSSSSHTLCMRKYTFGYLEQRSSLFYILDRHWRLHCSQHRPPDATLHRPHPQINI